MSRPFKIYRDLSSIQANELEHFVRTSYRTIDECVAWAKERGFKISHGAVGNWLSYFRKRNNRDRPAGGNSRIELGLLFLSEWLGPQSWDELLGGLPDCAAESLRMLRDRGKAIVGMLPARSTEDEAVRRRHAAQGKFDRDLAACAAELKRISCK